MIFEVLWECCWNGSRFLKQLFLSLVDEGDTNYHIGNSRFRYFVAKYKSRYQIGSREERQAVVQEIINAWRSQG